MSLIDPTTEVWGRSRSAGTERVVLLAIAKHADADGYAWPGFPRLQKMANVGERATQAALAKLIEAGELAVLRGRGRGHASLYRVLLGQPKGSGKREVMLAWLRGKTAPYLADLYEKVNEGAPSERDRKVHRATPSRVEKVQDRAPEKVQDPAGNAAAYRKELPDREEETPPAPDGAAGDDGAEPTSRDLLAEHIDALGHDLATKGQLAATIKRLLSKRLAAIEEVRKALALMRERGLTHPSVLPALVDEIRRGPKQPAPRNGRLSAAQQKSEREWQLELAEVKAKRRDAERAALRARRSA